MNLKIFFLIIFLISFSVVPSDNVTPEQLFYKAIEPFIKTDYIDASITRYQIYNGATRESSGSFNYDRSQGAKYEYSSPIKFQIICTDSLVYTIYPEKNQGFQFKKSSDPELYYDLDPLYRFFSFFSTTPKVHFAGTVDSMQVFYKFSDLTNAPEISFGISIKTDKLVLIEFFDNQVHVSQQIVFGYKGKQLPETIVTKTAIKESLLTDSLLIRYQKPNNKSKENLVQIPETIHWMQ